ncbi:MurR/RpiR family transcriptional regulator [Microbacterium aquimaris]|uniref:MurR/RpiR family transcriptional regulator n=1 Tax=Microbacterium aquimaris TaxID=459816 RepID=A0ABU5N3Y1_9MICO|nr:MurR/RpiR family transcriptional regulator [Microbacterium aquimaris]MDZ8160773.1 MurR/RpiR family transcriptional regulator [Microbacterium aquimaris]
MTWAGSSDAPPSARVAALAPSMQPSERRVAEAIAADIESAIDRSAQEVAEIVGVGRATVIRTAQTLGYDGYPQLRVALARELASGPMPVDESVDGSMLGALRAEVEAFSARLPQTVTALTDPQLEDFVESLDGATRVLVAANGLSAPLGLDLVLRLTAAGRPAEYLPDALGQEIAARQLGAGSVCVVISGSGVNRATLSVMTAARESGARVLAVTSFARSAVAESADVALVIPPVRGSFREELEHASRAALMLVTESLVGLVVARRGEQGRDARSATLSVLGHSLDE